MLRSRQIGGPEDSYPLKFGLFLPFLSIFRVHVELGEGIFFRVLFQYPWLHDSLTGAALTRCVAGGFFLGNSEGVAGPTGHIDGSNVVKNM